VVTRTIEKVLIANRGEIVVRIAATLRAMGIATVAVYSDADRDALHVRVCDEAVHIGPAAVQESYLRGDALLRAARATGADAIHPGYGFLSENDAFAEAVRAAGLVWIGPSAAAIVAMGSKIAAREMMEAAGVPVVPGVHDAGQGSDALFEAARAIGFPMIVKAAAGGGGKGMRTVWRETELVEALAAAQSEARTSFGEGAVYLEKLLVRPRHVEIQIFGDAHGQVVHLGERECSIQRRHQKIVEESPCPALTPELRAVMGAAAVKAAQAVGYVGAGTIEFLLDDHGGHYFLEMNTRLQVEHTVTECVTGIDLVRLQVRTAEGHALPFATPPELRGHAIEVRLYAEDPTLDFRLQVGRLTRFRLPPMPGIRLDTGFSEGDEVTMHCDPLLAKLIACGEDREHARRRLLVALEAWEIHGVGTNIDFLRELVAHPAFVAGATHTGFIAEHWPDGVHGVAPSEHALAALAVAEAMGLGAGSGGHHDAQSVAEESAVAVWRRVGARRGSA